MLAANRTRRDEAPGRPSDALPKRISPKDEALCLRDGLRGNELDEIADVGLVLRVMDSVPLSGLQK